METIVLLLSIVIAVLIGKDLFGLLKRMSTLEKRITDLEKASLQRLPYRSFEELLNAMAALDAELEERKFQTSLIENAAGHIANAMKVGTSRENK